jgi:hypothetical protein
VVAYTKGSDERVRALLADPHEPATSAAFADVDNFARIGVCLVFCATFFYGGV